MGVLMRGPTRGSEVVSPSLNHTRGFQSLFGKCCFGNGARAVPDRDLPGGRFRKCCDRDRSRSVLSPLGFGGAGEQYLLGWNILSCEFPPKFGEAPVQDGGAHILHDVQKHARIMHT